MSVTAAKGFVAAGGHCGIKASGEADLALVVAEDGAVSAAATFTANLSAAAPVQVSRRHLEASNGRAAAVVLNSGNANAATGQQGTDVAEAMAAATAAAIGSQTAEVLVCSTGLIGIPLPFDPLGAGIPLLAASLSTTGGEDAARAILTTDTVAKQVVEEAGAAIVGGMAKGAAMLSPNMATMLAVLTTDAAVEPPVLQAMLAHAVEHSFNRLSVDGCTSTNDTVIALASGRAGAVDASRLGIAMARACARLAEMMALDAEGATKVV
ncbi:MAG TPA: bifunctional ornithine acetyltransferase/N-acetylglutamate synthase, partial [Acidimicrobiales bacterium]|nr:bifunctional ornithine acetyltransferase/N-acetylglutamate synthase [Acidimicrobiales bacterium]